MLLNNLDFEIGSAMWVWFCIHPLVQIRLEKNSIMRSHQRSELRSKRKQSWCDSLSMKLLRWIQNAHVWLYCNDKQHNTIRDSLPSAVCTSYCFGHGTWSTGMHVYREISRTFASQGWLQVLWRLWWTKVTMDMSKRDSLGFEEGNQWQARNNFQFVKQLQSKMVRFVARVDKKFFLPRCRDRCNGRGDVEVRLQRSILLWEWD